eukprot:gene9939-10959_t
MIQQQFSFKSEDLYQRGDVAWMSKEIPALDDFMENGGAFKIVNSIGVEDRHEENTISAEQELSKDNEEDKTTTEEDTFGDDDYEHGGHYEGYEHECDCQYESHQERFAKLCHATRSVNKCLKDIPCTLSLPTHTSVRCRRIRNHELAKQKAFFKLTKPLNNATGIQVTTPLLDKSLKQTSQYFLTDKFSAHFFNVYFGNLKQAYGVTAATIKKFYGKDFKTYSNYFQVADFFRKSMKKLGIPYLKFPSKDYKYFTNLRKNNRFLQDRYFVEQRLAGMNPMSIRRVTLRGRIGTNWSDLRKRLNLKFHWENAIRRIAKKCLSSSIKSNNVYVVEYPLLSGLKIMPDILAGKTKGPIKMRNDTNPIAIFATKKSASSGRYEMKVVAIQIDDKPNSKVYTPKDGYLWQMAKAQVQIADAFYGSLFEHLLKVHFNMEPLCVGINRHLSKFHPLHEILKFHCRGLIPVNKNGLNGLLGYGKSTHYLFGYGNEGGAELVRRGFKTTKWNDIGLQNIKERGMDDRRKVPYYPYRDDGKLLSRTLLKFARDFAIEFYPTDRHVLRDYELKNLINELSADGKIPPYNGMGKIKGLKPRFTKRSDVINFLHATLWFMVQHSAVGYSASDIFQTAIVPTKLYLDPRAKINKNFVYMLPGWLLSAIQSNLEYGISALHYDKLFDYSNELNNAYLKSIVKKAYIDLMYNVKPILDKRNAWRKKQGHLTNPHMVPEWITNSDAASMMYEVPALDDLNDSFKIINSIKVEDLHKDNVNSAGKELSANNEENKITEQDTFMDDDDNNEDDENGNYEHHGNYGHGRHCQYESFHERFSRLCHATRSVNKCLKDIPCTLSLPTHTSAKCRKIRKLELAKQKVFFKLTKPPANATGIQVPNPLLDKSLKETSQYFSTDKFSAHYYNVYFGMIKQSSSVTAATIKKFYGKDFTTYNNYFQVADFFRKSMKMPGVPYFKFPSKDYKYFTNLRTNNRFLQDRYFVEQRLAGLNPMSIRRVTLRGRVGTNWSNLRKRLNLTFHWENAIRRITKKSLSSSIKSNNVYVVEYPLLSGLKIMSDILAGKTKGPIKMRNDTNPIAIFATKKNTYNGRYEMKVVAIQIDDKPSSKVYTPKDGYLWQMAKAQVQVTDVFYGNIFEHLLKVHLNMEPLCVGINRHLSKFHPLHEILKFHCRGIMPVNKNGVYSLLGYGKATQNLFGYGNEGAAELLRRGFKIAKWNDFSLQNVKERGMNDRRKVPYYPYRDDGKLLSRALWKFAHNFAREFYPTDSDVLHDYELKSFINELSADGKIPPYNGMGKVKGLKPRFTERSDVINFLHATLWFMVQHSAVGISGSEFLQTPIAPTKLYLDPRAKIYKNFVYMLPGWLASIIESQLAYSLTALHYDILFDYSNQLNNPSLKLIVKEAYIDLMYNVKPILDKRNAWRKKQGHLTNPHMVPEWITNSIST